MVGIAEVTGRRGAAGWNGRPPDDPAEVESASLASPRERRPVLVVVGLLLVAGAGLAGALLSTSLTRHTPVLAAGRDLEPGEVVEPSDLLAVELSGFSEAAVVSVDQQELVVGQAVRGYVPAGTILNTELFVAPAAAVPTGMSVVGATLDPGAAVGYGVRSGQRVDARGVRRETGLDSAADAEAAVLATGTVWTVEPPAPGTAGRIVVTLLVPADSRTAVAQAAADDRLRLALVES